MRFFVFNLKICAILISFFLLHQAPLQQDRTQEPLKECEGALEWAARRQLKASDYFCLLCVWTVDDLSSLLLLCDACRPHIALGAAYRTGKVATTLAT